MTTTTFLGITHLTANQASPEVVENESKDTFDGAVAGLLTHNMASDADYTLLTTGAPAEYENMCIEITDTSSPQVVTASSPVRAIIAPTTKKLYVFINSTAQSLQLKTSAGTGIIVATQKTAILRCDGTNIVRVTADA